MQDLQSLEKLEIEVLDLFNSIKVIDNLYFGGGTMLRLCHNLNRYSTDLDFWLDNKTDSKIIFNKIKNAFNHNFRLIDAADKRYTLLFEIRSELARRSLKIEIRKEQHNFEWERKIAFSIFTNRQVMVKGLTLRQMMSNKIEAFLSRKIIRDCFDIEFLVKRGAELPEDKNHLKAMIKIINDFKENDYKVILGSILDENDRQYYIKNKFSLLKEEIDQRLNYK